MYYKIIYNDKRCCSSLCKWENGGSMLPHCWQRRGTWISYESWYTWLKRRRTTEVVRHFVAMSPMTTWHLDFVSEKNMGGGVMTYLGLHDDGRHCRSSSGCHVTDNNVAPGPHLWEMRGDGWRGCSWVMVSWWTWCLSLSRHGVSGGVLLL